jgi:hypothetical protein
VVANIIKKANVIQLGVRQANATEPFAEEKTEEALLKTQHPKQVYHENVLMD